MSNYSFLDEYGPEAKHERQPGQPEHRNDSQIPRPMEARYRTIGIATRRLRSAVSVDAILVARDRLPGGLTHTKTDPENPVPMDVAQPDQPIETLTVEDSQARVEQALANPEEQDA